LKRGHLFRNYKSRGMGQKKRTSADKEERTKKNGSPKKISEGERVNYSEKAR